MYADLSFLDQVTNGLLVYVPDLESVSWDVGEMCLVVAQPPWSPECRGQVMSLLALATYGMDAGSLVTLFVGVNRAFDDLARHHWSGFCMNCSSVAHDCDYPGCQFAPRADCTHYQRYRSGEKGRGFARCGDCGIGHRIYYGGVDVPPSRAEPSEPEECGRCDGYSHPTAACV